MRDVYFYDGTGGNAPTSVVGVVYFKQQLDLPSYIGLGLIIAGVVVINVFSDSVKHERLSKRTYSKSGH